MDAAWKPTILAALGRHVKLTESEPRRDIGRRHGSSRQRPDLLALYSMPRSLRAMLVVDEPARFAIQDLLATLMPECAPTHDLSEHLFKTVEWTPRT